MNQDNVVVVIGAGGMGAAIARRLGTGATLVLADVEEATLQSEHDQLAGIGYDVVTVRTDVGDERSVAHLVEVATSHGEIRTLIHTAGLSPVQASIEAILKVDLLGAALVLDAFGAVIAEGGAGVLIASMAGHIQSFTPELEERLTSTPTAELLSLPELAELDSPAGAYCLAKRSNHLRVQAASMSWAARGARVNSISPGVIATPMGNAELNGPMGEGMRAQIELSAAGRIGTPEDIAAAAEFLASPRSSFITGTDLLVDGGSVPAVRRMVAELGGL
jgi:NAD(P)-dependent dehydrogenase (short-subunit alcohol dehydrogenase family)